MKHTPGPWQVKPPNYEASLDYPYIESWQVIAHNMVICSHIWGMGPDEDEANARLIAATPNMLKALEKIGFYPDLSPLEDPLSALDDMRQIAQAAIVGG